MSVGKLSGLTQHPGAAKIATETALKEAGRRWVGRSMNRVEDPRLLRGEGRYIDDISLPGMLHAAVLRSPHAHARIARIDTTRAARLPGVIRVVTGADVSELAAPLPSFGAGPIIQDMIATEKVRYYGETVAAVIACRLDRTDLLAENRDAYVAAVRASRQEFTQDLRVSTPRSLIHSKTIKLRGRRNTAASRARSASAGRLPQAHTVRPMAREIDSRRA